MRPAVSVLTALLLGACATSGTAPATPAAAPRQTAAEAPLPPECRSFESAQKMGASPEAPDDVAAAPADAVRTPSGLASKVLAPGCGRAHAGSFSVVRVHYSGWTTDGRLFDSSVVRGESTTFPLNGVIAGWREGVKLMVVGEKRRFWVPEELAYKGTSGPQGTLVFDVELLEIVQK